MGDSGSHLLGFILAAVAIQGSLKTAATVALIFPLIVLAVPLLDTSFVIAKRLKYGRPLTEPTPWHLYHRFRNIGFTQRRAAIYFYVWGLVLAGGALATRFVPFREHGEWHLWPTVLVVGIGLLVLATSLYMVIVLEILKFGRLRAWAGRRQAAEPDSTERVA
jgi:UDP-GlcNAc:undecaprenyl-phosphate GlcNAc-1-phosphate transferase